MGYGHYWMQEDGDIDKHTWHKLTVDVQKLVAAWPMDLVGNASGTQPYVIDREHIILNGSPASEAYETFTLRRVPDGDFSSCKTFGRPYNGIVCAILAIAVEHASGAIKVLSDGPREDWEDPVGWASEVLGRSVPNPILKTAAELYGFDPDIISEK